MRRLLPALLICLAPFAWANERPKEELYHLPSDPDQIRNVASDPKFSQSLSKLRKRVKNWMMKTKDPRADNPFENSFDKYRYFGGPPKKSK